MPRLLSHPRLRPVGTAWLLTTCFNPLASAVWAASIGVATMPAAYAQAATIRFDIAPGALDTALDQFARATGTNVAYDAAAIAHASTTGLAGNYTAAAGLTALLQGSGFDAVAQPGGFLLRQSAPGATADTVLRPVTVLGSREPGAALANVPGAITVLSREQIQKELPTAARIEDVIARNAPGFNPTNNGVRQIRGRNAQVFINGVPLNESLRASAGADLTLLAPDQIGSIEVARGANSAYGFGSPGGIIALNTPRADSETLTLKTKLGTSVNTDHVGGSAQTSVYQSAAQIVGAFDYHVGFSARRDGLTYDADGERSLDFNSPLRQSNTIDDLVDVDVSLGYEVGAAGALRLAATLGRADVREAYDSDFSGTYRGTQAQLLRATAGDRNERRDHTVNLSYENADIAGQAVKLEMFTSRVRTKAYEAFGGTTFLDAQTNEYHGVRSSVTSPLNIVKPGASLNWGLDWIQNRYYRPYTNADTGALVTYFAPDVEQSSLAPYVQAELPFGAWRLNAGVRHERYRGHVDTAVGSGGIGGGDVDPFSVTLVNLGVVADLTAERQMYATFSQGAEITQLGRAARDAGTADNVNPRPAKSDQYEIGIRQDNKALNYSLAVFYTESDLISALQCDGLHPCTPLREPREFWGIEGTLNWQATTHWSMGGTLAWLDGIREIDSGATRRIGSRDTPPLSLSAYMEYAPWPAWHNRLQTDYRSERDPFHGSTEYGEGAVDSVTLTHLLSTLDIGPGQLTFGIHNLFDRKYFAISVQADNTGYYWIPEQGRRVSFSYTVNW